MKPFYTYKNFGVQYPNEYFEFDDCVKIRIFNSEKEYFLIIDKEDFQKVSICNWKIREDSKTVYGSNSRLGFIHRFIMGLIDKDKQIDHINGNGLDNRKCNLRIVTNYENCRNKRNALGIYFVDNSKKGRSNSWCAEWVEDGRKRKKSFAISVYGEDAREKALEYRKLKEIEVYKRPIINK